MRTLLFDAEMGASGDMLLGALLAIGADRTVLEPVESALGVHYEESRVDRTGIEATHVRVLFDGADDSRGVDDSGSEEADREGRNRTMGNTFDHHHHPHSYGHDSEHSHDHHHHPHSHEHDSDHSHDHHHHSHSHEHDSEHSHEQNIGHSHATDDPADSDHPTDPEAGRSAVEGHGPTRSLEEVLQIVREMDLPEQVFSDATATFRLLAEAEAAVHGADIDTMHFHEVGADDAIADVVGTALLLDDLNVDRILTGPISTGSGSVRTSHGQYPVPPPAVVEIAKRSDFAIRSGPVEGELLTPTGAALLGHYAEGIDDPPAIRVEQSGYGAGSRRYPEYPNVLRATLGEVPDGGQETSAELNDFGLATDPITVLETTLDDATPEVLGGLQETLAGEGALDVAILPATLKKSRPGHVVQVVAKPDDAPAIARRLGEETGTLGVRASPVTHRWIAERRIETVSIEVGGETYDVQVKVATDRSGNRYDVSAEFDDALAVARETDVPVREVIQLAEAMASEQLQSD